jgi:hypothetical protein
VKPEKGVDSLDGGGTMAGMGHVKDLLVTIHNGGDDAVQAAVALAGLEKHMQAQVAIDNATGDITDIVTVLRGAGFAALSPSADSSASLLHYCVNHAADEIERLRDERRWIPVEERLPGPNEPVLIYTEVLGRHVASVDEEGEWFCDYGGEWLFPNVTHWMPLPEPPAQ